MKPAKLDDLIRAFENRDDSKSPRFDLIAVTGLPGFKDFKIEPKTDFLAICGGTGTGKTAILELFFAAVGYHARLPERQQNRLGDAEISIELSQEGDAIQVTRVVSEDLDGPDFPIDVQLLDLEKRTNESLNFFSENQIGGVAEGVEPFSFTKEYLALCSYICRKDYTEISVIEIEDGDTRYPFFNLYTESTHYDSFSASTGELSVLYLTWALRYSEPFSIFLIEEPEAYLPPIGQSAIIYLLYKAVIDRGHSIFLTTHSAEIVSKMPESAIISIRSNQGTSELPVSRTSKSRVLAKLGLGPSKSVLVFVEDEAAKDVVLEILSISPIADLVAFEVAVAGKGDGAVKKSTEAIPDDLKIFGAIGVLDGDLRARAGRWRNAEKFVFTPFDRSIELEFLEAISSDIDGFAESTGRSADACRDAIEAGQGMEQHQRFAEAVRVLRTTHKTLRAWAFPHWLRDGENSKKVETFISDMTGKLGLPRT